MNRIFSLLFFLFTTSLIAQNGEIKGTIKDVTTGETVVGATVMYAPGKGTLTDINGNFSIKIDSAGTYNLIISYVGFEAQKMNVKVGDKPVVVNFDLKQNALEEVEVVADVAKTRETPIAFSNVSTKQIQEELGTKDLPMVLNTTPGAYATEQGGGSGDARINIRGFDQRYVAVMVDGVPVNDMENGAVYWSNWDGLGDITRSMQVQRGLGASKLAIPSVGGTINIITKGIDQKMGAQIKQEINDFGLYKTSFGFNSGNLKGDWGITMGGSHKWGDQWADGTFTDAYSYFIKVQKRFKKHLFSISANGAPQKHGQRLDRLPIAVYSKSFAEKLGINADSVYSHSPSYNVAHTERGLTYNPNWGMLNGEAFNERVNYFHKPAFNLSHFWSPNEKVTLSNVVYLSIGKGGGTGMKTTLTNHDSVDGLLPFQGVYQINTTTLPNSTYSSTERASSNYLRASINNHIWYGIISTLNYKVNSSLSTLFGLDLRSYKGTHYQTPYDLMGGDFVIDVSDKNQPTPSYVGDPNWQIRMKRVGDKTSYYNDSKVMWGGFFAQIEYKKNKWSMFGTFSISETGYQRIDYFKKKDLIFDNNSYAQIVGYGDAVYYNGSEYLFAANGSAANSVSINGDTTFVGNKYILNAKKYTNESPEARYSTTGKKWFLGYTVKGGANYNINDHHNVFINLGYLNMAPLMSTVFDINNQEYINIQNQKVYAIEGGYGFKHQKFAANVNLYYTIWKNKPSSGTKNIGGDTYYYNILGLNALHEGVEIDLVYKFNKKLEVEGIASLGDWRNTSGSTVEVTDENGKLVEKVDFSAINVHVSDAAQTQLGGSLRYTVIKGLYIKPRFTYFSRHYAFMNPTNLTGLDKDRESWKIPAYSVLDLFAGYNFDYWKMKFGITAGMSNVLNSTYITDAQNGTDFNATSALVFMGSGRRMIVGLKIGF